MNQRNFLLCMLLVVVFFIGSCVSTNQTGVQMLSKDKLDLISETVCEIIVKKTVEDSLSYEKDLKPYMELLPLWFRNDEYLAIGTAFAISETRMLTAMHVLSLDQKSMIYKEFYIRDHDGNVFEIGNIFKLDSLRDIVEFDAKGKTFSRWLTVQKKVELNSSVFSVGSIIGEGIITRPGVLTSQKKNEFRGRTWNTFSFSADASPGNSGGPLLNIEGEVIGIILSRNEEQKLGFALPISDVLQLKANYADKFTEITFGFGLFEDKLIKEYSYSFDLPLNYIDVREKFIEHYFPFYNSSMNELMEKNKASTFPEGTESLEAHRFYTRSNSPEIFYQNSENLRWTLSSTKTENIELKKNGYIKVGTNGPFKFVMFRKPDDISLIEIYKNPEFYLNTLLTGLNDVRKVAGHDIRITSYGKPFESHVYEDKYSRKWLVNYWLAEYNNSVVMTFSLPSPMGLVTLIKTVSSSDYLIWEYDYRLFLDFVLVGCSGTFKMWQEFLSLRDYLPNYLKNIKFSYTPDESVEFESDFVNLKYDTNVFQISDESYFNLYMGIYPYKGKKQWAPRKVTFGAHKSKNTYFTVLKSLQYVEGLEDGYKDQWKEIVNQEHPLDSKPFYEDQVTQLYFLHPDYSDKDADTLEKLPFVYSMSIGVEDKLDDEEILDLKEIISQNVVIK